MWTETRVDPDTLPPDGSFVEYELDGGLKYRGDYIASEGLFWTSPSMYYHDFEIIRWRLIAKG